MPLGGSPDLFLLSFCRPGAEALQRLWGVVEPDGLPAPAAIGAALVERVADGECLFSRCYWEPGNQHCIRLLGSPFFELLAQVAGHAELDQVLLEQRRIHQIDRVIIWINNYM